MSPSEAGTLVAVDGTALAYRSHFAFINRPLTTRSGEVTSAVFGFILGLRRVLDELRPDRLVVAFDPPGPTFRHEKFPAYKAQRERMPPDLRSQLPRIEEWLEAEGIPHLSVPGYEADDVLAALAVRAVKAGLRAVVVSNDKDLLQMVGHGIRVAALGRGGSEPLRGFGPDEVRQTHGVAPEQIVDFLALTGDASDNVPGVPGVGKKTAAKLLAAHGTLEGVLAAAADMKKSKLRENLRASRKEALFSRDLVQLDTGVQVPEPDSLRPRGPDPRALDALFAELEFESLRDRAPATAVPDSSGYAVARAREELRAAAAAARRAGRFCFGVIAGEADAARAEPLGLTIAVGEGRAWYVPLAHTAGGNATLGDAAAELGPLFRDGDVPRWGQDVKRDLRILSRAGFSSEGVNFDTMLASYVLDPSRPTHDLEPQAAERLGVELPTRDSLTGTGRARIPLAEAPVAETGAWAAARADAAFQLRGVLEPELERGGLGRILRDVELPLLHVLARVEERGVRLDTAYLKRLSGTMAGEIARLEKRAWKAAGCEFNLASPKQVAELLFGELGLRPKRRTKTGHSTDADVLAALATEHEVPGIVLRHREVSKLKSTYVDALPQLVNPRTGRVHTTFQQAVAATGRLSSTEPNLQNVPIRTEEGRRIRKAFVPAEEGWVIVSCDYSQVELRILAHMTQDPALLEAFRHDRDAHRATAARIFDVAEEDVSAEQRGQAKTINYAVLYGMGAVSLGRALGMPTREAARFIDSYFERHPLVAAFVESTQERARETLVVETLLGRRRPVPEIAAADHRTRAFGERIAVNSPLQGTAADIMKLAMIRTQSALDAAEVSGALLLTVHDELVAECPAEEREEVTGILRAGMESALELSVPLRVEAGWGTDWSEAH